jgi:hypothetical protein
LTICHPVQTRKMSLAVGAVQVEGVQALWVTTGACNSRRRAPSLLLLLKSPVAAASGVAAKTGESRSADRQAAHALSSLLLEHHTAQQCTARRGAAQHTTKAGICQ